MSERSDVEYKTRVLRLSWDLLSEINCEECPIREFCNKDTAEHLNVSGCHSRFFRWFTDGDEFEDGEFEELVKQLPSDSVPPQFIE